MELLQALLNKGYDEDTVSELIATMKERVLEGEDPEEILFEEGLEPDYVLDLLKDW